MLIFCGGNPFAAVQSMIGDYFFVQLTDSYNAGVIVLIPFIGWGVYIMGLIQAEFDNLGVPDSDYTIFVQAIPFQLYAILAILLIPLVAFTKKDFSLMKQAEEQAAQQEYSFEDAVEDTADDGAFVSFATGSSWGTFAIMMPLAIPMAHAFEIPFAIAVGAVLSGGLFGDHCSPISDTTILSSTGAECDLVEHVKTQLPYAVVNGVIAFICYLVAGVTRSPLTVILAVALQLAVIFVWNKMDVKLFDQKA